MFFAEVIVRKSAIASLVYFLAIILPERKVDPPGIYEKPFTEMYDYIVVGAGSAGSVVATRLSEDCDTSVLLLEAGISDLEPDDVTQIPSLWASLIGSEKDWGYRTVQQKYSHLAYENERAYIAQGKVLGGSSSINAQNIVRGSRNNYDQWEHEGAVGWGYDDVLPFFRKLENATDTSYGDSTLRGLHGPIVIKETTGSILQSFYQTAAKEIGFSTVDCNSDDPIGSLQVNNLILNVTQPLIR
ncbi:glucose dehydrogenase [FAD, quinone]-like [Mytilus edulis]|uniref:glucose dehydrogenase [FAD, quinone]-like n=1 Tax=Mytilus edulis TaxID=6550 RepID=UPI0039F06D38